MNASQRVMLNTASQAVRAFLLLVINLFATRIILNSLGVEDYGVYVVIAGVIALLSFVTNAMVVTTQRFLSVAQGKNDIVLSKTVFSNSVLLHVIVSIISICVLECIGPFLFNGFLNIPENRLEAAKYLYQLTIAILCFTFIASPYRAIIVAKENIVYITIIEIIDGFLKLLSALALVYVDTDKLVLYGIFLALTQLFNLIAFFTYSMHKYQDCIWPELRRFDSNCIKEQFQFAGWTIYNIACVYGRTQGISVVINRMYGAAINASYGLAFQVTGALAGLSQAFMNALNPQLMKSEGGGNRQRMMRIAEIESKFSFFFLCLVGVPAVFEMSQLLTLWLGTVPDYAILFCRMVIIATIVDMITSGLGPANQATGNIKTYTIVIYTIKLGALLSCYATLKLTGSLLLMSIVYVAMELISSIIRIPMLLYTMKIDWKSFVLNVFIRAIIPTLTIVSCCALIVSMFNLPYRFVMTYIMSGITFVLSIFYFGLCPDEKRIIIEQINKIIKK